MKKIRRITIDKATYLGIIPVIMVLLSAYYFMFIPSSYKLSKEGLRRQVWDTVRVMADYGSVDCSNIGYELYESEQHKRFLWLLQHTTTDELLHIMKLPDATLKAHAFKILILCGYEKKKLYERVLENLADTTSFVIESCGCLRDYYTLKEYLIKKFVPRIYGEAIYKMDISDEELLRSEEELIIKLSAADEAMLRNLRKHVDPQKIGLEDFP